LLFLPAVDFGGSARAFPSVSAITIVSGAANKIPKVTSKAFRKSVVDIVSILR